MTLIIRDNAIWKPDPDDSSAVLSASYKDIIPELERLRYDEDVRCPGCGRNLPTFCRIGCSINDCPLPKEVRRLHELQRDPQ
jgi:hypothetical protein